MQLQFGNLEMNEMTLKRLYELGYDEETLQNDILFHEHNSTFGHPAVYCGTYAKYNNGSLQGMWIDITSFSDYADFINFCEAIHADEDDPELMFQDYENFPREYYDESDISEDDFEAINEYSDLCEKYCQEAVDAYIECLQPSNLDGFEDSYAGEWDSEEAFAENIVAECYDLDKLMGDFSRYFDYDAFARDLFDYDYEYWEGYVFRR